MTNPPGYNTINNEVETVDNTERRLPSYSSIDINEFNNIEINIKLENYKLKKNIKNVTGYGYLFLVMNLIFFLFSLLSNKNTVPLSNYTVINNYNQDDDDDDVNNKNKIYNILTLIYISLFLINIIKNIIHYNFNFKYLTHTDKKILNINRTIYKVFYYFEKIVIFIFIIIFLYNIELIIKTNHYLFYVITIYIIMNNIFDLFIQFSRRDLFLLYD